MRSPGRVLALLSALAAGLAAAFVFAPGSLAASGAGGGFADEPSLIEAVRAAFVDYWSSGSREFSPALGKVVDYWFLYHVVKAVIAAILLAVLVALGRRVWTVLVRAGGLGVGRQAALASGGVVVTMLAVFSLATVMANVQGTVAPFASLLPMLVGGAPDARLADTLAQVRQRPAGAPSPPALDVMVSDFSRFHMAMAAIATVVALVLIATSVMSWRKFAGTGPSDRRTRRALWSFGVFSALLSLGVIVVAVANATIVADPEPALLALFNGGW